MYLTFTCPSCETISRSEEIPATTTLACAQCEWKRDVDAATIGDNDTLTECLRCGNPDLWRQKNFPPALGLAFVAAGAVLSSIAIAYYRPLIALGILMVFALIDMVLYIVMPDVLVCYRCQSKHHHANVDTHGGFDHELGEKYRQEKIRLAQAEVEAARAAKQSD